MKEQFLKTKACPYFSRGLCANGSRCTYAHSQDEIRPLPELHKTKLCESVTKGYVCDNPECCYAHHREELRASDELVAFKTSLCFFHKKGRCLNGTKCRFAHGSEELVPNEKENRTKNKKQSDSIKSKDRNSHAPEAPEINDTDEKLASIDVLQSESTSNSTVQKNLIDNLDADICKNDVEESLKLSYAEQPFNNCNEFHASTKKCDCSIDSPKMIKTALATCTILSETYSESDKVSDHADTTETISTAILHDTESNSSQTDVIQPCDMSPSSTLTSQDMPQYQHALACSSDAGDGSVLGLCLRRREFYSQQLNPAMDPLTLDDPFDNNVQRQLPNSLCTGQNIRYLSGPTNQHIATHSNEIFLRPHEIGIADTNGGTPVRTPPGISGSSLRSINGLNHYITRMGDIQLMYEQQKANATLSHQYKMGYLELLMRYLYSIPPELLQASQPLCYND